MVANAGFLKGKAAPFLGQIASLRQWVFTGARSWTRPMICFVSVAHLTEKKQLFDKTFLIKRYASAYSQ